MLGSNEGKLYQIIIESGKLVAIYQAHKKKVTCVFIKETSAILSVSYDGFLKITSLCPEFDNMEVDM